MTVFAAFLSSFERKDTDAELLGAGMANLGEANASSAAGGGAGGAAAGLAASSSAGLIDSTGVVGDDPISRATVKKLSKQKSHEFKRKEEMELRRRR